jgi:cytochrome c553
VKKIPVPLVALIAVLVSDSAFSAGDPAAGQMKIGLCAACHGVTGVSNQDVWPNLAAQKPDYILKQLHAFKNDDRTNKVMNAVAKYLSDDDMNNLAAYFAKQPSAAPQIEPIKAAAPPNEKHSVD